MFVPVDIDVAWPAIEADVRSMLTDPDEFGPEKLIEACHDGSAWCLKSDEVYVIAQVLINPKTGFREFIAWIGVSICKDRHGAFERTIPLLKTEAARFGCVGITFFSPHKAWLRKATNAGFRLRNLEFFMPLETCH